MEDSTGGRSATGLGMSFGGAEGINYDFVLTDNGDLHWRASFETTVSDTGGLLLDWLAGGEHRKAQLLRIVCYFLVSKLPAEGLEEAADELNGIGLFYTEDPPQLPTPRHLPVQSGTVLGLRTRSELVLGTE